MNAKTAVIAATMECVWIFSPPMSPHNSASVSLDTTAPGVSSVSARVHAACVCGEHVLCTIAIIVQVRSIPQRIKPLN